TSSHNHRGFQFNHPGDDNSVLDGFTITQGRSLHGSGIWCINSSPTIQNCKIIFNLASDEGGAIKCDDCAPVIRNCTIHSNTTLYGGGICLSDSDPLIINCTLHSNTADWGGGLYCGPDSVATVRNCIFWGDTATNGGPEIMLGTKYNSSTLTVSHCVVEGGKDSVLVEGDCRLRWYLGNHDVDPGMTPDGHLRKGSVCIDAGTSADAPTF
ncbi:MAG: right-handed parallel beta-helix repeat-containing protein, partial [Planctomycetes bacterium]|nr:right-handed parallel beta-helix repeat-containing protein [Planctomycetota bacterium]